MRRIGLESDVEQRHRHGPKYNMLSPMQGSTKPSLAYNRPPWSMRLQPRQQPALASKKAAISNAFVALSLKAAIQ